MRIITFPSFPSHVDGYGIAVASDLQRLSPQEDDCVIWYNMNKSDENFPGYIIPGPPKYSLRRMANVFHNKLNCEVLESDIKNIPFNNNVDYIFCGDVHFYRALRGLFPHHLIHVRFHNCYSRISERMRLLGIKGNIKYKINLRANRAVEKEIFNDNNVHKIFISEEDRLYYTSMFGKTDDSEVWGFQPVEKIMEENRIEKRKVNRLVWVGSCQAHKRDSVDWFINEVFIPLNQKYPWLEFHLWGGGTELFDDPSKKIFGHGRYSGNALPNKECGLFVNPDITGGGVKIKLLQYFEDGVRFISTPFGYEGYPHSLIDGYYCNVLEPNMWLPFLIKTFDNNNV